MRSGVRNEGWTLRGVPEDETMKTNVRAEACNSVCNALHYQRGDSMPGKNWMNETTKGAVIADRAAGLPMKLICERYAIDASTVWRVCKKIQQAYPESAVSRGAASTDLKTRITSKAYNALEGGLDCVDDAYKRGVLAHQVLKEIGSLTLLGAQNEGEREFLRQLSGLPEHVQARYLNSSPESEPRILSAADHETWALNVFTTSGMSAVQFNRERESARRGERRLVTGSEEVEEFFHSEEVRAAMVKS
jgi:hypothetical protein